MDDNNASEEIASPNISTGVIDHTCDDNGVNLLNTEKQQGVTYINYINGDNDISMNDGEKNIQKFYAPFSPSNNIEDISSG